MTHSREKAKPQSTIVISHEPELNSNLLLGSIQLLFWLFFRPQAWRGYIAGIDLELNSGFSIAELRWKQWRNPRLLRLLIHAHLVLPILVASLTFLAYRIVALTKDSSTLFVGIVGGFAFGLFLSTTVSVACGLVGSTLGIITWISLMVLVPVYENQLVFFLLPSITIGLVGYASGNFPHRRTGKSSFRRRASGVFVGILGSLVIFVIARFIGFTIPVSDLRIGTQFYKEAIEILRSFSVGVGAMMGISYALSLGRRTHKWGRSFIFGVLLTAGLSFVIYAYLSNRMVLSGGRLSGTRFEHFIENLTLNDFYMIRFNAIYAGILSISIATWFALAYTLAESIAGAWVGTITGAITLQGFWLLVGIGIISRLDYDFPYVNLLVGLCCMALCMAWSLWRFGFERTFYAVRNLWYATLENMRRDDSILRKLYFGFNFEVPRTKRQVIDVFTLTIKREATEYMIEANGPNGVQIGPQPFNFDPILDQKNLLTDFLSAHSDEGHAPEKVKSIGVALYESAFPDNINAAYKDAKAKIVEEKHGTLRLQLRIRDRVLAILPWEAMHDEKDFIAANNQTPVVRILETPNEALKSIRVRGALHILFVGGSPTGKNESQPINIEGLASNLKGELDNAIRKKQIVFDVLLNADLATLQRKLRATNYHVLCFVGHGSAGVIYLSKVAISAGQLAPELKNSQVRLVFLAACNTATQPSSGGTSAALSGFAQDLMDLAGLPVVVAMQYRISEGQTNPLITSFFDALAHFYPVDIALAMARRDRIISAPSQQSTDQIAPPVVTSTKTSNWLESLLGSEEVKQTEQYDWTIGEIFREVFSPVMYLHTEDSALFRHQPDWAFIGLAMVTIITVLVLGFQFVLGTTPRESVARNLAGESRQILTTQPELVTQSALLAIESLRRAPTLEGELVLRQATRILPSEIAEIDSFTSGPSFKGVLSFNANGSLLVSVEDSLGGPRKIGFWDTSTWQRVGEIETDWINDVDLSPDGNWIAVSSGGYARVWEIEEVLKVPEFVAEPKKEGPVASVVAFNPDSQFLAIGGEDGVIRVQELTTGREITQMKHDDYVSDLVFSPAGKSLASTSWDNTMRVWNIDTGQEIVRINNSIIRTVIFSPDGKWIATEAGIFDAASGREMMKIKHDGPVEAISFSPDGKYLATGSADYTAKIWEVETGNLISSMKHKDGVNAVDFSPDGKWLVTASEDKTARLWNVQTGNESTRIAHQNSVKAVSFSSDGRTVISGAEGEIRVWEILGGAKVRIPEIFFGESVYALNGDLVAYGEAFAIPIQSISIQRELVTLELDRGSWPYVLALSSDSRRIGAVCRNYATNLDEMYLWNLESQQEILRASLRSVPSNSMSITLPRPDENTLFFDPDNSWIAWANYEWGELPVSVEIWDAKSGREMAQIVHEGKGSGMIAFSADGKWLATSKEKPDSYDDEIRVWKLPVGEETVRFESDISPWSLSFSPDSKLLAVGGLGDASLLKSSTGEEIMRLEHAELGAFVTSLSFSPDGRWLATSNRNTSPNSLRIESVVRVWDVRTGEEVLRLEPYSEVEAVAFSPDGQWLAAGGGGDYDVIPGIIQMWNAKTGQEVHRIEHQSPIDDLLFSPDGRWLVSDSQDGAYLWAWHAEDLIADACARLDRNLTREEWRRYFGKLYFYRATCPNLPVPGE